VELDPETEVLAFIGTKIGMNTVPPALLEAGEVVLCPDPCYTGYHPGVNLVGGELYHMPLLRENGFLPDLEAISEEAARRAKAMYLNYPGNPTAALATPEFFSEVVAFARRHEIVVAHDAPYSQTVFDGQRGISFLETPGAKEVGIEFNSLSKVFNMTGWRIGYAVGNAEVLAALGAVKSNTDMGIFEPIQHAGIAALNGSMDFTKKQTAVFQSRRDVLVEGLNSLGWDVIVSPATFFLWTPIPDPSVKDSRQFAGAVLDKAGLIISPGIAFGQHGEGYIRIALTRSEDRIREAVGRLETAGFVYR
jgi:LL-diaminopimelate aminotransferase